MKRKLLFGVFLLLAIVAYKFATYQSETEQQISKIEKRIINPTKAGKKKTPEERALFNEARVLDEFYRLADPNSGDIPKIERVEELAQAQKAKLRMNSPNLRAADASFVNRGPSNLGGRTRTIVVDRSDNTGNTIIAGGVSGGVFRTINGGTSWTRVSPTDDIHNVTCIVQDPRAGFENTWYYGTGESLSGSPSTGASLYLGRGIWQSTDGGLNWAQFTGTSSTQELFDSTFDFIYNLGIDPTTGFLYAAVVGQVLVYLPSAPGPGWFNVQAAAACCNTGQQTDVAITTGGRIYIAMSGGGANSGVWATNSVFTAPTKISSGSFTPPGRVVLGLAPSNQNKLYVLFDNGNSSDCAGTPAIEADLWMWNQTGTSWTDYSGKLPDETGCSNGNDPFAVQGGYNLVVSVKPDNENFVVIGGTNAYKMADITGAGTFSRIGGYALPTGYAIYSVGGTEHHPDIHALVFNPFNNNELFSGTDGGIHKTTDVTAGAIAWTSLNNNYQTQQYYHVAIDPQSGSDYVIGGLQDNGTNEGGTSAGQPDLTTQVRIWSGDGVAAGISRDNGCVPLFVGFQNGPIYRVFRDCAGFTDITPNLSNSQFVTYFFLDPDNNKTLYYAGENIIYRTNDATNVTTGTWTNMGAPSTITGGDATEWPQIFSTTRGAYNSGTSYLLMGTDEGNIYRLNDPQNAANISGATKITPGAATITFPTYVSGLAIHPTNPDIVLVTYSNYGSTVKNIFLTTNATNATPAWTEVERNLSAHSIRSAAITVVSGEVLYLVGTGRGLYSTSDPTSVDWVREAPNEIGYALVRSMAYRPADNKLLIGTHGNGMFEATITQVLDVNEFDISDAIRIYPNPVESELNVSLPSNLGNKKSYVINNILGQVISKGDLESNTINVSQLQSGVYFIQITAEGKKGVKQFIKK